MTVGTIHTIIFETHIAKAISPPSTCEAHLLTVKKESPKGDVPALDVAEAARTELKTKRGHLGSITRVLFSSTLGVVVYRGQSGAPAFKGPKGACTSAEYLGHNKLCEPEFRKAQLQYSAQDMAEYAVFVDNQVPYFVARETQRSLNDKVNYYVRTNISEGWVVFDADRDENTKCSDPASFERLAFINSTLNS